MFTSFYISKFLTLLHVALYLTSYVKVVFLFVFVFVFHYFFFCSLLLLIRYIILSLLQVLFFYFLFFYHTELKNVWLCMVFLKKPVKERERIHLKKNFFLFFRLYIGTIMKVHT